jgi:hypothetical protein
MLKHHQALFTYWNENADENIKIELYPFPDVIIKVITFLRLNCYFDVTTIKGERQTYKTAPVEGSLNFTKVSLKENDDKKIKYCM